MSRELGRTRKDGTPELEVQSNPVNLLHCSLEIFAHKISTRAPKPEIKYIFRRFHPGVNSSHQSFAFVVRSQRWRRPLSI